MPRSVLDTFRGWLQGETMEAAVCVKITTPAPFNTVIGFTTWDSDIALGGVTYEAQNAVLGSVATSMIGAGVDNMEVTGILVSVSITDADIYAGKYDQSRLQMFIVNPADLTMLSMVVINGVLGDFKTSDGKFVVELRSLTQLMSQQVGDSVVPTCQVTRFGDARCKFNVVSGVDTLSNPVRSTGTVTAIVDDTNLRFSGIVTTGGYYTYGLVKFLTGLNANIEREVKVHGSGSAVMTVDVSSVASSPGRVPFNSNLLSSWLTQCGTNFTFAIPGGTWVSAYLSTQETWHLRSQLNQGTVGLYVQVPTGDQYLVANEGWSGFYQHNVAMSPTTMTAINALASGGGGTMSCCLQFHNDTAQHLLDINVNSLILTLEGTPSTTSDIIQLGEPFPYPVAPGDTAYVTAGCDRLVTTCASKWNNVVNFRGFPYLPGIDLVLSTGHS